MIEPCRDGLPPVAIRIVPPRSPFGRRQAAPHEARRSRRAPREWRRPKSRGPYGKAPKGASPPPPPGRASAPRRNPASPREAEADRILESVRKAARIDEEFLRHATSDDASAADPAVLRDHHLAPSPEAMRAARTPPEPAPITKRSVSNLVMVCVPFPVCAASSKR